MKSIINYSLVLFLLIAVGCTKDIDQFNNNDKSPTTVPANSLFANATVELMDYLASPNVCLLYTSDAADEGLGVDLGGRRIIKNIHQYRICTYFKHI